MRRAKPHCGPFFRDTQSSHGGNVILGFVDSKHIHHSVGPDGKIVPEQITYLPCDPSDGYWQFAVDEYVRRV